jgi:hypothetical protein
VEEGMIADVRRFIRNYPLVAVGFFYAGGVAVGVYLGVVRP